MIQWLASLQPALLGGVLVWASALKLLHPSAPAIARRSALRRLVGTDRVVHAYRAVGVAELVLGALLILPPAHPAESAAAVAAGLGMLGYLTYARVAAPDSSCGCLGERHAPVEWRNFARAGVLVLAAALSVLASSTWLTTLAERPLATVGLLAGELAVVVVLSPELDTRWLHPLRRLRVRISHPLASSVAYEVPLGSSVQQLHKSEAYRSVYAVLRSDLLDSWDEGDWRILTYSARPDSGPATAVFAVPRLTYRPEDVRVVLVDDTKQPVG
jgi:hypothetical protein